MKILGSIPAKFLVYLGAAEMTGTILACYSIAVSLGHVKPWLPTISACGDHAPEEFLFRFGIFIGALLLEIEAFALYLSKRSSGLTFGLGAVAAFCLGVVAVVGANENDILHTTSAVIFFVFEDLMSVLLTVDSIGKISCKSMSIKIVSCLVACGATIMRTLLVYNYLTMEESFPGLAIFEWSNTAAIVVFQLSLADDMNKLYLAISEADSANTLTMYKPRASESIVSDLPIKKPLESNPV